MDVEAELRDVIWRWKRALRLGEHDMVRIYRTRMRILRNWKKRKK